jgi:radical SAM superfamily enzyme YgiQ (UPF0313 family)
MNVHLVETPDKHNKYTYRLLFELMRINKICVVSDPKDADLFLVSVDDPSDLPLVKRARKIAGDKPLIAGGFECYAGEYLLAYCDALNVGEGFEFFEALGKVDRIEDLYNAPYILTKDKARVIPSTRIDNEILPLVRLAERHWYYLAGKGCIGKCAFCMTSFTQPYWNNDTERIKLAYSTVKARKHNVTFITNDSRPIPFGGVSQSVRVVDYLKNPVKYKSQILHFGIEGFTEERRRWLGKPIKDADILELIYVLTEQRQNAEFFFITGFENSYSEMMAFINTVPCSAKLYPRIFIKLTGFEPSPHTPLWTYDIRKIEWLSEKQFDTFHNGLKAKNLNFRLFAQLAPAKKIWRAIVRRANPDEIKLIEREPDKISPEDYIQEIDSKGLGHLLTYSGYPMPSSQIVTPWKNARDKFSNLLGMDPVNYKGC